MTDLRQAAQMALQALEGWEHCDKWVWPATALEQAKRNTTESLAALRTALEQQAEPVCPECKAEVLYECVACSSNNYPAQQQAKPVAWGVDWGRKYDTKASTSPQQQAEPVAWMDKHGNIDQGWDAILEPDGWMPLYTAQHQYPWVGLTDAEIEYCVSLKHPLAISEEVEAKLKEKNS